MQKLFLLLLLTSVTAFSQTSSLDYSNRISIDSLKNFVFILSADSMAGRETGKPGQKMAADFLASKYESWGLIPAGWLRGGISFRPVETRYQTKPFLQNHPINIRTNRDKNLVVSGEKLLFGKDFIYPDLFSDTSLSLEEFIFIRAGMEYASQGLPVFSERQKGKNIILKIGNEIFSESGTDFTSNDTARFPFHEREIFGQISDENKPAVVFAVVPSEKIKNHLRGGFDIQNSEYKYSTPVIYITDSVAMKFFKPKRYERLVRKIKDKMVYGSLTSATVSVTLVDSTEQLRGQNVIAYIEGSTRKNETIVISSHYDHLGIRDTSIYYGADDNASGTAGVLEMARIFKMAEKENNPPKRNILFLNVSGEEKGLLGSKWYVANPSMNMSETIANLNIDMIGRIDTHHDSLGKRDYVYIIGSDKLSTDLHNINENQNKIGPALELNYKFNNKEDPNKFYKRSDHYNFVKKGVPVIFYFDGMHPDYHKPTDTPDKIDVELLAKRTRLIFLTAWELANRDERIVVDKKNEDAE